MITVSVDPRELAGVTRWFAELDKISARANRRALAFAGKKARSLAVKEIAARVGVQQKSIRRRLKVFIPARLHLGAADFVRLWLGLQSGILPTVDKTVAKGFPNAFRATTRSGKTGLFVRRPNKLRREPRSSHANPTVAGRPNPKRHSLPIDRVRVVLERRRMIPIVFRHARAAVVNEYPREFRRLLELNARRAARR